ncbi:IS66-like element accessory protein TnpA [Rhizobium lusitanum]|jgi:transposase|uniref:IS66-like element accessory protein TnpA n=1 Tax=Rhizobium lusitanum TaxID=293958 RepID=UPI000B81956E|nr:transposase [Rhizobium lusitanum]
MDIYTHRQSAGRLEIVDSGRRRRFSNEVKRRIVAESLLEPGLCSVTARRHGISRSQLYEWRRLARAGKLGEAEASDSFEGFIPAIITTGPVSGPPSDGRMEVVSANGRRVIVDREVDIEALVRIIRGLETLR